MRPLQRLFSLVKLLPTTFKLQNLLDTLWLFLQETIPWTLLSDTFSRLIFTLKKSYGKHRFSIGVLYFAATAHKTQIYVPENLLPCTMQRHNNTSIKKTTVNGFQSFYRQKFLHVFTSLFAQFHFCISQKNYVFSEQFGIFRKLDLVSSKNIFFSMAVF